MTIAWRVPDPISVYEVGVDRNTKVILRRHGNPDGIRLLLSHGNGLAIDFYYPFWSRLLADFDVIVYDMRNHGWNMVGGLDDHNVPTLVNDHDRIIEEINLHYGEKTQVGVYHSLSSLTPLLSQSKGSEYSALVLFDPPVCKPGRSYFDFEEAAIRMSKSTRRRTFQFKSKKSFTDLYKIFPTYKTAVPGWLISWPTPHFAKPQMARPRTPMPPRIRSPDHRLRQRFRGLHRLLQTPLSSQGRRS